MSALTISTFIYFAVYMVIMLVIAVVAAKRSDTVEGYTMGGYKTSAIVAALSLFATQCSASSYLGWGGLSYNFGLPTVWNFSAFVLMWPLSLVAISIPVWKWTKAYKSYSFVDAVASRYDSVAAKMIWGLLTFPFIVVMMIAQYRATGLLFNICTGYSYEIGVIIGGVVVAIYMLFGGKLAELWTNAVQGIMMILIAFIATITALVAVGGFSGYKQSLIIQDPNLWSAFSEVPAFSLLTCIFFFGFYFCLITPYNMPTIQGCKNLKELKRGVFLTSVSISLGLFAMYFIGSIARGILGPDIEIPDQAFIILNETVLSPWVAGFIFAGILAAIMSSVDSMGLMAGTCIGTDFYLKGLIPYLGKDPDNPDIQNKALLITRIMTFVALIVPIYFAIYNPPAFLTILLFIGLGGTAAMFCGPVFNAILFPKFISRNSGVFSSLIALAVYLIVLQVCKLSTWYALPIAAAAGIVSGLVISKLSEPLPAEIYDRTLDIK